MKRALPVTVLVSVFYLTIVGLSVAAVWTARGQDISSQLGMTALVLFFAGVFGGLIGGLLSILWEDRS